MCVVCRERFCQETLLRLQCQDGNLQRFGGSGRSFYICETCQESQTKQLTKALSRQCKKSGDFSPQLKEIIKYVGQN